MSWYGHTIDNIYAGDAGLETGLLRTELPSYFLVLCILLS